MRCRGQVSLYLVIGVVLILFLVLGLIFESFPLDPVIVEDTVSSTGDFAEAESYIQYCLEESSKRALLINGKKGGLYNPENFFQGREHNVAYHYQNTWINVPSVANVEQNMELEFNDEMDDCLFHFTSSEEDILFTTVKSDIIILNNSVQTTLNSPITIIKETKSKTISTLAHTLNQIHIPKILDISRSLAETQRKYLDSYCKTCITRLAINNFAQIDFETIENKSIYTIIDMRSRISESQYEMVVAHEH